MSFFCFLFQHIPNGCAINFTYCDIFLSLFFPQPHRCRTGYGHITIGRFTRDDEPNKRPVARDWGGWQPISARQRACCLPGHTTRMVVAARYACASCRSMSNLTHALFVIHDLFRRALRHTADTLAEADTNPGKVPLVGILAAQRRPCLRQTRGRHRLRWHKDR